MKKENIKANDNHTQPLIEKNSKVMFKLRKKRGTKYK